jgi:murein tripeptide amidase MpaA
MLATACAVPLHAAVMLRGDDPGLARSTSTVHAAAFPGDDEVVFATAQWHTPAQLQLIASRVQHAIVDRRHTARFEASRADLAALQRAGIQVMVDDGATKRMVASDQAMGAGLVTSNSIPGYACYRTVEETYGTMDLIARDHPQLASVASIGPTWERARLGGGYDLRVLKLTNSATDASVPGKPNMVLVGAIHAREYTTAELLTRFAEWLADGYGIDDEATWLLDNFRFHFILQANPDGRKKAESGLSWRKNTDTDNGACSASNYGIDLNRNFPYRWNATSGGSSGDPCAGTYRGPAAISEPEANALLRYAAGAPDSSGVYRGGVLPDRRSDTGTAPTDYRGMYVDMHSYSQRVLWPWAYTTTAPPNAAALRTLGRRMAWFNNYTPQQWIGMYAADGVSTDAIYGLLGAPAYTIEMGVTFFEDCDTFESSTLPRNLGALRYAARSLQSPYTLPAGPDTTAISASAKRVFIGTPLSVTATVDDSRFNQANGTETVQAISSARAYLDGTPWAGASPIAMQASDGAFNASTEQVRVTISTSGLAPGRHMLVVQGVDASGRPGTPRAVYFKVLRQWRAMEAPGGGADPAPGS